MKLLDKFNAFFDKQVKADGIVSSFWTHWGTALMVFFGAVVIFKLASFILGSPIFWALALAAGGYAYFTHKADKRINGG